MPVFVRRIYYISHSHSVGVDHYTFSHHNILTLPNERVSDKDRAGRSKRRKSKTMEIDEKGETHHPQCLSRLLHSVDHHTWAPAGEGRHEKRETGEFASNNHINSDIDNKKRF